MLRPVAWHMVTDVSEQLTALIIRAVVTVLTELVLAGDDCVT